MAGDGVASRSMLEDPETFVRGRTRRKSHSQVLRWWLVLSVTSVGASADIRRVLSG